jgi:hypothetical protein
MSWNEPHTIAEATERRLASIACAQRIQEQLGNRNAMTVDGVRLSSREYWEWRNRAAAALRHETAELRRLNAWLKAQRTTVARCLVGGVLAGLDLDDPTELLTAACGLIKRLARDGVPLDADEQAIVDAMDRYLVHGPVSHRVSER